MAASVIGDRNTIRFIKCQDDLSGDPIIEINLYGNSSAVVCTKAEAARLVEALTRAAHTIHKQWSKDLE